jgi:hypothetical protein
MISRFAVAKAPSRSTILKTRSADSQSWSPGRAVISRTDAPKSPVNRIPGALDRARFFQMLLARRICALFISYEFSLRELNYFKAALISPGSSLKIFASAHPKGRPR